MHASLAALRRGTGWFVDSLLPPRCLGCGTIVGSDGLLCAPCWAALAFLGPPQCARCGVPFPADTGEGALCAACLAEPPAYFAARAALVYDDASRPLVLGFKHGDRTHAAPAFARWMARAGAGLLAEAEIVVPVPLHRWRLLARRYNQSALLARELGRQAGLAIAVDALARTRPTPSQGGLGRAARFENVRGAFAVRPRSRAAIEDRHVLLVDDVLTTGATVEACSKALIRAGAGAVSVLTLARVNGPGG
jgi:ComF family protein